MKLSKTHGHNTRFTFLLNLRISAMRHGSSMLRTGTSGRDSDLSDSGRDSDLSDRDSDMSDSEASRDVSPQSAGPEHGVLDFCTVRVVLPFSLGLNASAWQAGMACWRYARNMEQEGRSRQSAPNCWYVRVVRHIPQSARPAGSLNGVLEARPCPFCPYASCPYPAGKQAVSRCPKERRP